MVDQAPPKAWLFYFLDESEVSSLFVMCRCEQEPMGMTKKLARGTDFASRKADRSEVFLPRPYNNIWRSICRLNHHRFN